MDNGKYIRCRNCEAIHHVTAFDRSPIYQFSAGEVHETPANDWRDFMALHAGHKLEPLTVTGNHYFATGSGVDPMNAAYLEVTNGIETLLLHRTRRSIEEPGHYAVVNRRLIESGPRLEVQEHEIRKEMKLHFSWAPGKPLDDTKLDLFIALFREVVGALDPQAVSTSEYSYEDDTISYGQPDSSVIDVLMAKCSQHFLPSELELLRRFVDTHRDGCDVMALIKRRSVSVEPCAEPCATK